MSNTHRKATTSTTGSQKLNTIPSPQSIPASTSRTAKVTKRSHPPESNHSPRAPKRIRTQPRKPNLRLFTRDVKFALPLAPTKQERMAPGPAADEETTAALGQCVDLALKLLEEGRGNRVLVSVGVKIVRERRAEAARAGQSEAGIYKGDLRDMPAWVAVFLRQVREVGIPICVCDSLSGYGLTQRWAWGTDMKDYDCRNSAVVYIHQCVSDSPNLTCFRPLIENSQLVDGLLRSASSVEQCIKEQEFLDTEIQTRTRRLDSRTQATLERLEQAQANAQISLERAIFCISVFLAHEFVHCFTGFLTGSAQPGTPPGLNASPYSDTEHGEAGWYWTRHTFGGLGHVWFDKDAPAEPSHFGIPTLLEYNRRREDSFFYQLDHAVIRRLIGDWSSANRIGECPSTRPQFHLSKSDL